jgi:hypothetical protein
LSNTQQSCVSSKLLSPIRRISPCFGEPCSLSRPLPCSLDTARCSTKLPIHPARSRCSKRAISASVLMSYRQKCRKPAKLIKDLFGGCCCGVPSGTASLNPSGARLPSWEGCSRIQTPWPGHFLTVLYLMSYLAVGFKNLADTKSTATSLTTSETITSLSILCKHLGQLFEKNFKKDPALSTVQPIRSIITRSRA